MKNLILIAILFALPMTSYAAGNRYYHCRSKSAELVFHTEMHGESAIGDYSMLNGQRSDFPIEARYGGSFHTGIVFYNQNRIFQVKISQTNAAFEFILLAHFFADPTVLETGTCK